MLKHSPRKNQKSPNFMYGLQIVLSLAVSIWLLYQVKHLYDKAYTVNNAKVPEMPRIRDVTLKLGRKHMHLGRHGKLGDETTGDGGNTLKDTVHLRKGGEDEEGNRTGQERAEDEEELLDIEDLIDEEDKDVDEVSEELQEKEDDNTSASEHHSEGRHAELLLAARADII